MKTKNKKPVFIKDFTGTYKPRNNNEIIIDVSRKSWLERLRDFIPLFIFRGELRWKIKKKIKKIIELDKSFLKGGKYKVGKSEDEIKGYECAFKFQLKRLESLLNEKEKTLCKHKNKDIEIDEKRFFCKDCGEWINCEDIKWIY